MARGTLSVALDLGPREVVALVGAGGKTTALRCLAEELTRRGAGVIATTTTAMLLREMEAVGPVFRQSEGGGSADGLKKVLGEGRPAAVIRADGEDGKVIGLTPAEVDRLWALGVADYLLVEADGSRGLPFKAFGPHEPQVPAKATKIVAVAGLDALGTRLTEDHVHRADVLAALLHIPLGAEVTTRVMVDGLRAQIVRLRRGHPGRRVVALLNKGESPVSQTAGGDVARELLGWPDDVTRDGDETGSAASVLEGSPDAVVVGSLHERRFTVVAGEA